MRKKNIFDPAIDKVEVTTEMLLGDYLRVEYLELTHQVFVLLGDDRVLYYDLWDDPDIFYIWDNYKDYLDDKESEPRLVFGEIKFTDLGNNPFNLKGILINPVKVIR